MCMNNEKKNVMIYCRRARKRAAIKRLITKFFKQETQNGILMTLFFAIVQPHFIFNNNLTKLIFIYTLHASELSHTQNSSVTLADSSVEKIECMQVLRRKCTQTH